MKRIIIWILGLSLAIIIIIAVWEYVYVRTETTQNIYILPQNFRGVVLIAYDQQDGSNDITKSGKLIYKIPQRGVLKLKRKTPATLMQSWFYFEDKNGVRTRFDYCFDPQIMKKNPDKVYAFGFSNGEFENGGQKVDITIFLVGTEKQRDSLSKLDANLNPLELIR